MRILVTVSAWPGHWYPLVPSARALQDAGHDVLVACAPSQEPGLRAAGLPTAAVLGAVDIGFLGRLQSVWNAQAGRWPYPQPPLHPVTAAPMGSLAEFTFAQFRQAVDERVTRPTVAAQDAAVALARRWRPDLVVHELLSLEGLLAAEVVGVPALLHLWGPVGTREDEPGLHLTPADPTGAFVRHGLPAFTADRVRHVVDPCPEPLRPPVDGTRHPVRYEPYNGPGTGSAAPAPVGPRPRVAVVWGGSAGTVVGRQAFVLPDVVRALAALGLDGVVTAGAADVALLRELLGPDGPPPGVEVRTAAPLRDVLPGCSAVVHHGGAGVSMTSVDAGVPQLLVPCAVDQPVVARRIAATGAGVVLPAHAADGDALTATLADLLADGGRATAALDLRRAAHALPAARDAVADWTALAS
ncbi:glycosyltransferase [Kineococcus sp. NPDC059986]|jgi:UDP:flavonoid glycosyltransferase YjiC (YdhE family)|uniref:glycosyltransferase n=1 Tax=Kineococcus sp. NPDC059986 TaxID=3155538 RepID=UPI00344B3B6E